MAEVITTFIDAIEGVFTSVFAGLEDVVNGFSNLSSEVAGGDDTQ